MSDERIEFFASAATGYPGFKISPYECRTNAELLATAWALADKSVIDMAAKEGVEIIGAVSEPWYNSDGSVIGTIRKYIMRDKPT